jgi:molecular chaperone GrpE (heat shock protein)
MNLVQRLSHAWRALMSPSLPPDEREDELTVTLRRDLATTRLELQEVQEALAAARAQITALEKAQTTQIREGIESALEKVFTPLAAPLSQLQMQAALLEAGTAVAATDVMTLARQFATMVERAGLEPISVTGETIAFDPEIAQPLGGGSQIETGDMVRVRFIGYRYHGRVLRKALVEPGK